MKIRTHIAAAFALVAFALPAVALAAPHGERGERPSFPMPAETFMTHVNKRIERIEKRVEARLAKSKLSDEKKAEIRAKAAEKKAKVLAAAKEAAADGTVTKKEARKVRQAAGKRHHGKRGKAKGHNKGKARGKARGQNNAS
jgi:hypothetical protein